MFFLTKVTTYAIIASPLVLGYLLLSDYFPENFADSVGSTDATPAEYSTDYAPTAEVSDTPQQAPQYVIIDTTPQQSVWDNKPGAGKGDLKAELYPWQPSSKAAIGSSNVDGTQQQ